MPPIPSSPPETDHPGQPDPPPCRFCTLPDPDRVMLRSDNFVVMASLGPIVQGYSLIVSRHHYSCCAEISPDLLAEFNQLKGFVQTAQRQLYGKSTVYEHGRSGACLPEGEGEDHCFHAHLHIVPMDGVVRPGVAADYPMESMPDWSGLLADYERRGDPYLLVEDDEGLAIVRDPQDLPRHYLRSVAAAAAGEPHLADWVAFPGHDVIKAGVAEMEPALRRLATASPVA